MSFSDTFSLFPLHTHSLFLMHTYTNTLSLSLFLSDTLSLAHTHTLTPGRTHSLTQTYTRCAEQRRQLYRRGMFPVDYQGCCDDLSQWEGWTQGSGERMCVCVCWGE